MVQAKADRTSRNVARRLRRRWEILTSSSRGRRPPVASRSRLARIGHVRRAVHVLQTFHSCVCSEGAQHEPGETFIVVVSGRERPALEVDDRDSLAGRGATSRVGVDSDCSSRDRGRSTR